MDDDVDDGPSISNTASVFTVMLAFTEKWGLTEKLARSLAEFEDATIAARLPRRQVNLEFAACSQIKLVCVCLEITHLFGW